MLKSSLLIFYIFLSGIISAQIHVAYPDEYAPDTAATSSGNLILTGQAYGFQDGDLFMELKNGKLVKIRIVNESFQIALPAPLVSPTTSIYYLAQNKMITFRADTVTMSASIYKHGFLQKSSIINLHTGEQARIYFKQTSSGKLPKGAIAPDFKIVQDETTFQLSETVKKQFVLLNFSAIACEACWMAYPDLERLQDQYKDQLQIVVLYGQGSQQKLWETLATSKNIKKNWLALWNVESSVTTAYPLTGMPSFFLINQDQKIIEHWFGYRPGRLENVLKKHLK